MTASRGKRPAGLEFAGTVVKAGSRQRFHLPIARLPTTQLMLPLEVEVVHGADPGPRVWLSGAIHGDELNGIEIVRQVRDKLDPRALRGTVFLVPIVNGFGVINESRYLPDRRDLNRSFPGSARGSLASRLAEVFMREVVSPCSHGIDLHTGSNHRRNLPQVRGNLDEAETLRCAQAFGAPICVNVRSRDGSLRDAASRLGKHVLLYEAGEPLRFDREAIQRGIQGTLAVLGHLGILEDVPATPPTPILANRTRWIRARTSGLFRLQVRLGDSVEPGQVVGRISDGFGDMNTAVRAAESGIVLGCQRNPMVRRGDGLVNLACDAEPLRGVPQR